MVYVVEAGFVNSAVIALDAAYAWFVKYAIPYANTGDGDEAILGLNELYVGADTENALFISEKYFVIWVSAPTNMGDLIIVRTICRSCGAAYIPYVV